MYVSESEKNHLKSEADKAGETLSSYVYKLMQAERNDYVQRWQVSPPNGDDLSRAELRRETRRLADDYSRDKPGTDVAYAVHTDQEGPNHSHVLLTGNENDLRVSMTSSVSIHDVSAEIPITIRHPAHLSGFRTASQ